MATFDVSLYEPVGGLVTADNLTPTVDNVTWPSADGGILTGAIDQAYAAVNANVLFADIYEPVGIPVTADTTSYSADNTTWPSADGGGIKGARDTTDAEVISAELPIEVGGVVRPFKPYPIVGVGYAILPELQGTALGAVGIIGAGKGKLPSIGGAADGTVGVAEQSAGQLVIRALGCGDHGQAGAAVAVFKGLSIAGKGMIVVRGSGTAAIKLSGGAAIGRYDDDEAAVMALLLAA